MSSKVSIPELRHYFLICATYEDLSVEAALVAWQSARRSPVKALRCYKAIARSLALGS
jgi:hypothetical protein